MMFPFSAREGGLFWVNVVTTIFHSERELGCQDSVINSRSTFVLCFFSVVVVVVVDMFD